MATRTRNAGRTAFLSPETVAFLKRRARELAGIVLFLCGAALTAAVIGYDSTDPSWNHAVARDASNPLGLSGAWFADILMQSIGAAAILPGLVLMAWGWRVGRHRDMGRVWLRITALPVALLLAAIVLASLGAPDVWPVKIGLGGVTGSVLLEDIATLATLVGVPLWPIAIAVGLLALGALAAALGISRQEWTEGFSNAVQAGGITARAGLVGGKWSGRMAQKFGGASWTFFRKIRMPSFGGSDESVDDISEDAGEDLGDGRREPTLGRKSRKADREEAEEQPARKKKIVAARRKKPAAGKRAAEADQRSLDLGTGEYSLPPLDALDEPPEDAGQNKQDEEALAENARLLESVLEDFGVRGRIVKVRPGPVVTLYELEPAPGTKSSRVISLADDIARSMSAVSVRVAVVPGKNVIGIELPNAERELVALRELVAAKDYEKHAGALTLVLGKDIGGAPSMVDLARMPHLLIAGTTGSGKSVAVNTMIMSLLYRLTPDQCKFIMIDPKMLELSVYEGIPHLLTPVVTDPKKAVVALKWAVKEMESRYRKMSDLNVRNISAFNERVAEAEKNGEDLSKRVQTGFDPETDEPIFEDVKLDTDPMPQIVIIVDEMADLMLVAGKEIEGAIQRLAQMARAAGIHLIMATQRPSVDVITGTIKANFPTRISFSVTSKIDSRTILGEQGAEQLLGQGDMLFMPNGSRVGRVHGPFVSDGDVEKITKWIAKTGKPEYLEDITREPEGEGEGGFGADGGGNSSDDPMFDQAVEVVARSGKASTSFVQRQLKIGYNRAARIIEQMEEEGMVSAADHVGKREVLLRNPDEM